MPELLNTSDPVAKKKNAKTETKQYGTLIRVSDEFADAMRQASNFEAVSMRDFADAHLLSVVLKRYRDAVLKEAKKFGEKDQ